jgi:hypothetical protein
MRRVFWIMISAAVVALGIGYGIRLVERRSSGNVAALLPRDTVAFAHLPNLNTTIDEWHRSDIYQIYREPAVQEFLKNPGSNPPAAAASISGTIHDIQELEARDAFVALTSIENDKPKLIAGFNFRCSQEVLDRITGNWRSKINPSAKHDRVSYQKHDIDLFTQSAFSIATVQDQNWFFASNDLEQLKAVLDRADGRVTDDQALLKLDESYREAIGAMPSSYAALAYFQPKALAERLAAAGKSLGRPMPKQMASLQKIRSFCAATSFDHGKLHDLIYVGIPKQEPNGELTRSSLTLATSATIAYACGLIDFSKQVGLLFPPDGNSSLGPAAQKISEALRAAGIGADDWNKAFGSELSLISDWSAQMRWPSAVITVPVRDTARARTIVATLTQGGGQDTRWEEADRNGAHYWFLASSSSAGWFAVRPVMALTDRMWITGLDAAAVDAAIPRSQKAEPGLADSEAYRRSVGLLPAPTKLFAYLDSAQIYTRIDATVRPFLMMGAAFLPKATNSVDLTKIPPPEIITKHLSPIVSSQYYSGQGYVAESIGPVTLDEAGIGLAILGSAGAMAYHRLNPQGPNPLGGGISVPGVLGGHASPAVQPQPTGTPAPLASPQPTP